MLRPPARAPRLRALPTAPSAHFRRDAQHQALTVRFLTRWFLMRRANHARAVWPVSNLAGSGAPRTAPATRGLRCASARSSALLFGRLKKTRDQRSCAAWSFGGVLRAGIRGGEGKKGEGRLHDAVQVRAQDAAAKER